MILYRARTIASRPCRLPAYLGNAPDIRVRGRWFTSDIDAAIAHRATLEGPTEIVAVEIADAVAESFRVCTTPRTLCGIDASAFSASPLTDYVIPMYNVMDPIEVEVQGDARRRDVIDVNAPRASNVRRIRIQAREPLIELPLAA